ncbi:MAG: hypothetical protein AB7I09_20870 [Planctomycetota bacterium]
MSPRSFDPPFRTPPSVVEGGTIEIEAGAGVTTLDIAIPGLGTRRVRVTGGRAEFRVPPGVLAGTPIFVDDGKLPNPHTTTVWVVGGQFR